MASMVIRNIPDDAFERFKKRAKAQGKSAEQMAREVVIETAAPPRETLLKRMAEIRAASKPADLETTLRFMEEARAERDAGPAIPGLDNDR